MSFINYLADFRYWGLFLLLFLCAIGLPIPEDLSVAAGAYFASIGHTKFPQTLLVMIAGAISGNLTLYSLGRRYGPGILGHRYLKKFFTPERIHRINHYFHDYGSYTLFFARFLVGLRVTIFLSAGIFRLPLRRVLFFDGLSATLSITLVGSLVYFFGDTIRKAYRWQYALVLFVILGAVLIIVYKRRRLRRFRDLQSVSETEKLEPPVDKNPKT